jgi:hypothetical protein
VAPKNPVKSSRYDDGFSTQVAIFILCHHCVTAGKKVGYAAKLADPADLIANQRVL